MNLSVGNVKDLQAFDCVFVIHPDEDSDRIFPFVHLASEYVGRRLIECFEAYRRPHLEPMGSADRLYLTCVRSLVARTSVGWLLQDGVYNVICAGGVFSLFKLVQVSNSEPHQGCRRLSPPESPVKYKLSTGSQGFALSSQHSDDALYPGRVRCRDLSFRDGALKTSGFYKSREAEGLGSGFLYDSRKRHAVVFQPIAQPKSVVAGKGISRLAALGVRTVSYVVVTAPGFHVDSAVSTDVDVDVTAWYQLELTHVLPK